jgi:predicted aspartyl protease
MKFVLRSIKIFSIRIILLLSVIQLLTVNYSYSQRFTFDGNRKKQSLNFLLIKNLIIVPLYINGKGPFNFILDTGVNPLIITDASIIDSLNLKSLRTTKLAGLGAGNDIEAYLTTQIHVRLESATMNNMPTAILKQDIFNLSNHVGMRIYGLIGYYFFNSFTVKIKYATRRMIFALPEVDIKKKGERFPLEMISNKPYVQLFVSPEGTNKTEVKMILDIGASHAISLEALNGRPFPLPKKTIRANLGVGFAGLISGRVGRMSRVEIGRFTFKNVLASFPEFTQAGAKTGILVRNGNVGSNLLKHFDLTIDYTKEEIYLKPNSIANATFEHDMSGMEVYVQQGNPDLYFVGRVEPDSPAEEAGILTNDQLLTLNFKPVTDYNLDDIDHMLKAGDGKRVILQLGREDKMLYKILILKRRI